MLANREAGHRGLGGPLAFALGVAAALIGAIVAVLPVTEAPALAIGALAIGIGALVTYARPRAFIMLGGVVYVGAVHWAYIEWIVPIYAYYGLISAGVELPAVGVVSIVALLPVAWLPIGLNRPSDIVLWFLYLFGYVPATTIPIHLLGPELGAVLPFTVLVAVAFGTLNLTRRIPLVALGWRGLSDARATLLIVLLGLGAAAYLVVVFGFPTTFPDLETVYDARKNYAAVANVTAGAGYVIPWAGNVVFPLLISLGLARSDRRLLVLGAGGELLVYATTGFKTVLFSLPLVPALWIAIRWAETRLGGLLIWGGVAVVVVSVLGTAITGSIWPIALFVTRLVAVPGQMTAYYLDLFTSNPVYQLSRSFLRAFVSSPYEVDPPFLIGAVYLNSPTTDANANIWADAVANYGLVGIIPFTLMLGLMLWLLDSVSIGRNLRVVGPTLGLAGITLGNGAIFTSILTLGLGLTIALVALMPDTRARDSAAPSQREGPQPPAP